MAAKYSMSYCKSEESYRSVNNKTLIDCLKEHKEKKADENAFVFVSTDDNRRCVTWKELNDRSRLVGKSLIHLGVQSKEIVGINIRSCPEWLYAAFGTMMAGAIPVCLSFTYTDGSDVIALMEKMKCCTTLIMDPGLDDVNWTIIKKLVDDYDQTGVVKSKQMPSLRYLLGYAFERTDVNVKPFVDLLKDVPTTIDLPDVGPEDIATLCQTSGSTGSPKLVVYTHECLARLAETEVCFLDPNYIHFNDRPFAWIGGFPLTAITGAGRVTISGFCKPPENGISFIIETIYKEKCTQAVALPLLTVELIRRQDDLPADWPLQLLVTGGQPITKNLTRCIGKVCNTMYCLYGSTEALFITQSMVNDSENFTENSCGKLLHLKGLEVKIMDDNCDVVPVNTMGEIYVRTPVDFREYFNDEAKTRLAKTDDGWYRTDDMGKMNEDGYFFVTGRKSNMIISGGMNVTPEILEQALKKLPGVESAIAVPIPDPVRYQVVCACVIRKPGSDLIEEQLRKSCEELHADKPGLFTVLPKYYMFVEKFPETSTGKVYRKELERMAGKLFKNE